MDKPPRNDFHKQLFDENHQYIHDLAELKLLNKNLTKAVVEATFIKALHQISELENSPSPDTWLTNTALKIIEWCNTLKELPKEIAHDE